jgi:hypothetical protein
LLAPSFVFLRNEWEGDFSLTATNFVTPALSAIVNNTSYMQASVEAEAQAYVSVTGVIAGT